MKKKVLIIILAFALLVPTGVILAKNALQQPLDPPMALDLPPQIKEENTAANPAPKEALFCGNSGKMRILEIGIASPLEVGHPGADAIRLIVVDFDEVRAGILALPSDLWVNTPEDLVDQLGPLAPLNQIYLAAYQNASGNPDQVLTQKATEVLAQTILDEFGFVPDKYININGDSFIELVDALGGVTITLEEEIDASHENFGIFPAGEQTLDGQQTLDFVRIFSPLGTAPDYFGQFGRQAMVIQALLNAFLNADNWQNAPDLVKEARKMVVTDLSVDQANDLTCMVKEVDGDAELFLVDSSMIMIDDQGRMIPDMDKIQELMSELEAE